MNYTTALAMSALACAVASIASCEAAPVTIASRTEKPHIVARSSDPLVKRTADWLRQFLAARGVGATVGSTVSTGKTPVWVLETAGDSPFGDSVMPARRFAKLDQDDVYALTVTRKSGRPIVSIVGRGPRGVRSGVARLMAIISEKNGQITAPETAEFRRPFIGTRRLMVCPTGRIALGNEWCKKIGMPEWTTRWQDTLWENWPDERIRKYAEQLWLYGFNSVELCEIRGYRGVWADEDLRTKITPKLRVFMKAARDNGLQVSQFIWGQSLFEEGQNLCWNSPDERARMEAEYRRLARTYGDLVDHIIVHVGDPGGCSRNGCDAYKTTQEIATFLLREYRKVNSHVGCTLSTWANAGFWNGDGGKFLDSSFSPTEIGIALHRWYDAGQARLVRESGRQCDIWGWYLSDFELDLDMALLMRRLDSYYTALPDQASEDIRALSTEICFHGWPHIINAYVTAQKMWDPRRKLEDIEREFCAATFGDQNADAMLKVYQAAEEYVHPERYYGFIPASDCLPVVLGTADYNKRLRVALAAGKTVDLGTAVPPRFTASTDPKALHAFLMDDLQLISIFSEAQKRVDGAKSRGATAEELATIFTEAEAKAARFTDHPDYRPLAHHVRKSAEPKSGQPEG